MANHKSSKKRILVTEKKRRVNVARKSATKTAVKKAVKAIAGGDKSLAMTELKNAESKLAKAAKKVMPKKRASRKISRLAKAANKIK